MRKLALALLATTALAAPASAQTNANWVGATGSWFTAGNWDTNAVPDFDPDVDVVAHVRNGGTSQVAGAAGADVLVIGGTLQGGTVELQSGGSLLFGFIEVRENGTLLLSGSTAVSSLGTLLLNGVLRATTTGTLSTSNVSIAGGFNTVSASAGNTLTLAASLFLNDNSNIHFGTSSDNGTIVLQPGASFSVSVGDNVGVAVDGGTLRAGNSGLGILTAGAVSTTIAAGATLDFNDQAATVKNLQGAGTLNIGSLALSNVTINAGTYAGTISGVGGITKETSGTLTLSGVNTYAGLTTVNAGVLSVNGLIGDTTVNAGGTLMGTGQVGGVSVNGGLFAPGSGAAGTTQVVNGSLGFSSGGIYRVFVNPTQASSSTVTGAATLTGGTVNAEFAAGSYVVRSYTILTAATRTGTFDALTTTNLPIGFSVRLGYATANAVTLDLFIPPSSTASLPPNQQAPADAVSNYFNSGGALPPGFVTLVGLTGDAQLNGYAQVSGEGGNGATKQTAFAATNQFLGTILDPFIFNRGSDADIGTSGATGYADSTSEGLPRAVQRNAPQAVRDAYAAVTPRDTRYDSFGARWSVWAAGYGGSMSVDGNAAVGSHTTTSSIYGTAVGIDYRVARDTLIGFAMGGAGTSFNTAQGLGSGHADLFQFAVYGRHSIGAAYIAGALAYGWQDVTTERTITVAGTDRLRADFSANTFAARAETGYRFAVARMGVTPYTAVQATAFHLPSYAEAAVSGSNQFALSFASNTTTNVRTELGFRTDKSIAMRDGLLILRSRVAWAHDSNTDRSIIPTFQSLPGSASFAVTGAQPAADSALVAAGAEIKWKNGWAVAAKFEGEFSSTTESYAGTGTVRYVW
jgi:autotransporter-associated beta strand protein